MPTAHRRLLAALVTALFFLTPSPARAADVATEEFKSAKGFSLRYPADWTIASKEFNDAVKKAATDPALSKLKIDLDRVAVGIFKLGNPVFAPNLNVVVVAESLSLRDAEGAKTQAREMVNQSAKALGARASNVSVAVEPFHGAQALVTHYVMAQPNGLKILQRQVIAPGNDQTYIITCSALVGDFGAHEPAFKAMLDSLKIDTGTHAMPVWLKTGLIGGALGAAVGLILWVARRANRQPRSAAPIQP